jgi:hypothetical protein
MEKPKRVSIALLCIFVAVVAVDLAWWRHLARFSGGVDGQSLLGFQWPALDAPAMAMGSVLVVGLAYALSNRGRVSRRLVGFLLGGLAGLVLYLTYGWVCLILPEHVVEWSILPMARDWPQSSPLDFDAYFFSDIVYFGTPQLFLAAIGARIAGKGKATSVDKDS